MIDTSEGFTIYNSDTNKNVKIITPLQGDLQQLVYSITKETIGKLKPSYSQVIHSSPETYPSKPINDFCEFISIPYENIQLGEKEIDHLRVAFSELLANANEHGNRRDQDKKIFINCGWDKIKDRSALLFSITDEGSGFDINTSQISGVPGESGLGLPYAHQRLSLLWNQKTTVYAMRLF